MNRRVVITGMGVVTPLGNDLEVFWKNLLEGRSGIVEISRFDTTGYDCRIAGEVRDFDAKTAFNNPKEHKRTDRFSHLAMGATKSAMRDSGIDLDKVNRDRFGVLVSSGIGGLKTLEDQHSALVNKGPGRVSAFTIPMLISNMASGLISMEFGLRGPNMCIVTACATSNNAIGEAWRIIKFGDADIFLAGGAEASVIPVGLAGFSAMKALSTRNDDPQRASRPFDRDRDGFVMGEGAGVMVVEELEHAKARGAKIWCELSGYGLSGDAYHMTAPPPDGEGAARAMKMALDHAGLASVRCRLRQRARHFHWAGRHLRNARDQNRLRRACEKRSRNQLNQIDDRPFVRRSGRGRDGGLRHGDSRRQNPAHDQPRESGSGVRS